VRPFIRFRSQPSGNTGGQHDTPRLLCHDANWRGHAERKLETRMPCPHTLWFSTCWGVF